MQVTSKNLFWLRHMTYGLKIDLAASLTELMVSQFKTPKHLIVLKDGLSFQWKFIDNEKLHKLPSGRSRCSHGKVRMNSVKIC